MKFGTFFTWILSLLLIASIGLMQYAIVTDDSSSLAISHHDSIKKTQDTSDLFNARDVNDDDDEDAATVKYSAQQFYNCDVFSSIHFFRAPAHINGALLSTMAAISGATSIYQEIRSYRI